MKQTVKQTVKQTAMDNSSLKGAKMKKKSVVAMLVMCMAFTAAACGSEKETKATTQETTDKKEETKADKKEAKEDTAESSKGLRGYQGYMYFLAIGRSDACILSYSHQGYVQGF